MFVLYLREVITVCGGDGGSPHHNRTPSVDSAPRLSIMSPFNIPAIPHWFAAPPRPKLKPKHSHHQCYEQFVTHAYFQVKKRTCD